LNLALRSRLYAVPFTLVFSLIALIGVITVRAQESTPEVLSSAEFSGERAFQHVANHVNSGLRIPATLGNIQAGNIILNYLEELGWSTAEDWHIINFGEVTPELEPILADWQPFRIDSMLADAVNQASETAEVPRDIQVDNLMIPIRNLVANYGTNPAGGAAIILGAHYDSRIYADKDPDPNNRLEPMPGANDGGSGVGVLLELARVLSEHYTPNTQIRLVFFDAEDQGRFEPWQTLLPNSAGYIVGSSYYAGALDLTADPISQMILVDLVGEFDQRFPIEGYGNQYFPELSAAIWQTAADLGYQQYFPNEVRGAIIDDHVPFIARNIPSADIIDLEYEYWDTTLDTLDKIDPMALERVGRVLVAYLENIGAITRRTL